MRGWSLFLLGALLLMTVGPTVSAVHQDSNLLLKERYAFTGLEGDRQYFNVTNIDTYPWVCYLRSYVPDGTWGWHASVRDPYGNVVVEDMGAQHESLGVHVGVPLQGGYAGQWSLTVQGGGLYGDTTVEIHQVKQPSDCAAH